MRKISRWLLIPILLCWGLASPLVATPYRTIEDIDGIVNSEWAQDELRVDDPDDDSGWNSELNEIKELYLTWDGDRLYIGLMGYTESFNAIHIVIDADYGAGTGETDFSTGYAECRQNCQGIEDGWGAELMYVSDGMSDGGLYSLNAEANSETMVNATTAANSTDPKGYEISVSWDQIYGLGEGLVPPGCTIAVVAILGNAAGDYCSSETAPDWVDGSYTNGALTFDRSCHIIIDSNGDGLPDDFNQEKVVVLELLDLEGDDYGPGTYLYPTGSVFVEGAFDFTSFKVSYDQLKVYFELGIAGQITNPWGSESGFSLQNIDIYIDEDGIDSSGSTSTLEGRNALISPNSGWEKMIWCAPSFDTFRTQVIDQYGNSYQEGVTVFVDQVERLIKAEVPKAIIGEPDTTWAYIVLMLGQDGYSPGRVRPVNQTRGQWNFGGGDDGESDANILDMVLPPGLSQEAMLANYNPSTGQQPVLYAHPDTTPPLIVHQPITMAEEHLPLPLSCQIVDDLISQALIYYRAMGEAVYDSLPMTRQTGQIWQGRIPGAEVTLNGLEYYLFASDGLNSSTFPSDTSPYQVTVTPDSTPPSIDGLYAEPTPFSPNNDGYQDTTLFTWTLTEPAYITITVYDSSYQVQRVLLQSQLCSSGENRIGWDGRGGAGEIVPNGPYPIRFEGRDLSGYSASPVETSVIVDTLSGRKLDLIFLFHFNQNLVPYGKVANRACYVGLLETLRAHPRSKFLIHISGSLIHDLLWFDDRAIRLIRDGVEAGQFEILGSTYIQNVMYSTRIDSLDFQFNDKQIKKHKELIEKVFGVIPKGFWNPERTWTQNFVQLLADNGYEYVQVEDHILFDSGITGSEYLVRTTGYNGRELIIFDDDKTFEGWINYDIDSGDYTGMVNFLHQLYEEDLTDQYAVCYHEDAEASGLWDYENEENPQIDWRNLDSLLTLLENDPLLEITTYGDWLQGHQIAEEITPIVDGAALWMGGDSWFAENNSANMNSYRAFFDQIRDRLNQVEGMIENFGGDSLAASRLLQHAWSTLCAHQYEFGCHGLTEHSGFTDWDLARCALISTQAAEYALSPIVATYQDDINGDSIEEIVMVTLSNMWVFSPYGGRLIYWFDLERGEELVGNENFMYYGESYISDNRYLPTLRGGVDVYTWLSGNYIFPEIFQWRFQIRRRALNDWVLVNGTSIGDLVHQPYIVNLHDEEVEFVYSGDQVNLTKTLAPGEDGLDVRYLLQNKSGGLLSIDFSVESGFSPSYRELMDGGRASLRYWDGEDTTYEVTSSTIGVKNMKTGTTVFYLFDTQPTYLLGEENVFGLELNPGYQFTIPPDSSQEVIFSLMDSTTPTAVEATPGALPSAYSLSQNYPNPFNATTLIRYAIPDRDIEVRPHRTTLQVYNILGQEVKTLVDEEQIPGHYFLSWDGRDSSGRELASGVYFYRMEAGDYKVTKKMVLLK